jgi:hypothetical protein
MSNNNLATLVKDITYYWIKYYYDKEIVETKQNKLEDTYLKNMIDRLYTEKSNDLKKYIRDTLKENLKESYSSFAVENILLEMFNDPEYSKHRVLLEIIEYQKNIN